MRKEMGNQNTSGIVEEKAASEAVEETRSTDGLKNENEILVDENGTKDTDEKNDEADSHDAQSVEKLTSEENEEVSESVNEDCETRAAALFHVSTNDEELKESNLEVGTLRFNDEVHDQQSHEKGEEQRTDLNLEQKSTSTVTSLNSVNEAVDITSGPQDEQNILVTERALTLESSNIGQIEEESLLVDDKLVQNIDGGGIIHHDFDDHDVRKNDDEMVVSDIASGEEGAIIERISDKENSNEESTDNTDDVRNERTSDHLANTSSLDIAAAKKEPAEELLVLDEENLTLDESRNGNNSSFVDQTDQPAYQATSQAINCSIAQSEIRRTREEPVVGVDSLPTSEMVNLVHGVQENDVRDHSGLNNCDKPVSREELEDPIKANDMVKEVLLVQTESSIGMEKNQEEENLLDESTLENVVQIDNQLPATTNDNESKSQSSLQIEKVTEPDLQQNAEAEIPPVLSTEQDLNSEISKLDVFEPDKGHEAAERLSTESNKNERVEVVLRKSPSFEFGLPFRPEESDQTPLLYHDRTAIRSFSSCSTLRFHNTNVVQTNYFGKYSLHEKETVEMEEKTIRMERSSTENVDKANVVMQEKQVSSASDIKHENGLKGSLSEEDRAPKGNGKRKPRSSLFATCICCTAEAIS